MGSRFEIAGKTVLITGAGGGIGRCCAMEFHRAGANVVAASRSADRLDDLRQSLGNIRILTIAADVTNEAGRAAIVQQSVSQFGRIDVLVNNAGWASFGTLSNTSDEDIRRMIDLNFHAPVALMQALAPLMAARGHGQIINISSVVGEQPMAQMAVYCATKAALNAVTTSLRMELRDSGVDVLLVSPGSTRTDFFHSATKNDVRLVRNPQRQDSPESVARAILRASRTRRIETVLSANGRLITIIRRISHRLADRIMVEVARRSMPRSEEGDDR